MNNRRILLIGGGGHCKSVIDVLEEKNYYSQIGVVDMPDKKGSTVLGYVVLGCDSDLEFLFSTGYKYAFITLGSIECSVKRTLLNDELKRIGFTIPNIISKSAIVSNHIKIGYGNFVAKGVIINADVIIEDHTIINSGSIIEHDCHIESYVHVAPGSTISGVSTIERGTHIGTNSTVIQNICIGENTVIGAGSVVVKNIRKNVVAYGVPCKEMRTR